MKLKTLAKRLCSSVMAGLTAISIIGSSLPAVTNTMTASAASTLEMPTADEFIARACKLLGAPYTHGKGYSNPYGSNGGSGGTRYSSDEIISTYGVDCSGLIAWTLGSLGMKSSGYAWNCPVPIDTEHWLYTDVNCTQRATENTMFTWTYTKNGKSVSEDVKPLKTQTWTPDYKGSGTKLNYWQKSKNEDLPAGSIIIAEGYTEDGRRNSSADHAWIYLGKFSNRDEVIDWAVDVWDVPRSVAEKCVGDGKGKGGTHWRIESTSTTTHSGINYTGVMINNDVEGKASGAYQITGMKPFPSELNLQKVNENGEPVAAVSKTNSLSDKVCTYGIYKSKSDAQNDKNRVATVELGASKGSGSVTVEYIEGGYYAKEIEAPAGYTLSDEIIKLDYDNVNELKDSKEHGKIVLNKSFADGKEGTVTFEISGSDGKKYTKTLNTENAKAKFVFDDLPLYIYSKTNGGAEYAEKPIVYTITEKHAAANDGTEYVAVKSIKVTLAKHYDNEYSSYRYGKSLVNYPEPTELLGEINIIKKDAETDEPIEGAEFSIYPENEITFEGETYNPDTPIVILTDNSGEAHISGIPLGKYTVKETKAAAPYYLEENSKVIELTEADRTADSVYAVENYELTNKKQEVRLKVYKTDGKRNIPLAGAEFTVMYNWGETIGTLVTDENGYASSEGKFKLYADDIYVIAETKVPDGYINTNFSKTFKGSYTDQSLEYQELELRIENMPTTVTLSKKSITGDDELPGASLQVLDKDGNVIDSWISGTEPHEIVGVLIPGETYTLHEEIAPDGYVIANDVTFTVSDNGDVQVVEMIDDTTKVEITKYDSETGAVLEGAELQIIDSDGNVIDEWISAAEPHIVEGVLVAGGSYILHEVTAPENYELAEDIEFTVSDDGRIDSISMFDNIQRASVKIYKRTPDMTNISGIKFILSGTSNLGKEIYLIGTTDDNGEYVFENVPLGTYSVSEDGSTVPCGYITAQSQTVILGSEDEETEFFNDTTKVRISKKDITDSEELPGATLQIIDTDGIIIDEWTSGNEPHYIEGVLNAGDSYTLHEEVAPDGYVVANDIVFTVLDDGSINYIEMFDDTTKVKISKKDITDNEELPGAILKIIDSEGNIVDEWVSTTEPHYIEGVLICGGSYTLHEESAPDGYVIANDIEFTVSEDGSIDYVEMFDDTTKVIVSKQDITTGEELPGATLRIIDKNGNVVEEWISTNEPHRIEGKLTAGEEYTLRETLAPEGYDIASDIKFTVNSDGSVQTVVMKDELIPETPPTTPPTKSAPPTTTDTPNPSTGTSDGTPILLSISVVLLGAVVIFSKKSDRSE